MSNCKNKISDTCSPITNATCTKIETPLPLWSSLTDCPNVENTTAELYSQISAIKLETDLSALGTKCLTYILDVSGKKVVKNILLKYEDEICAQKLLIIALQNKNIWDTPIAGSGINLKCLIPNNCDLSILTLKDLAQALINKACPLIP